MSVSDYTALSETASGDHGVAGSHIMVVGGHGLWQADPTILASRASQLTHIANKAQALSIQAKIVIGWCEYKLWNPLRMLDFATARWFENLGQSPAQDSYLEALRLLMAQAARMDVQSSSLGVQGADLAEQFYQLSCVFDGAEDRARMGWGTAFVNALPLEAIPAKHNGTFGMVLELGQLTQNFTVASDGIINGHTETVSLGMDGAADLILSNPFAFGIAMLYGAKNDVSRLFGLSAGKSSVAELLDNRMDNYFYGDAARSNTQLVASMFADMYHMPLGLPPLGSVLVTEGQFAQGNGTIVNTDKSLSQIITRLDGMRRPTGGEEYLHGNVHVIKHETSQGTSWSVLVQGTQNWSPYSLSPQGLDSDIAAVAGQATTHTAAVLAAMRKAGIAEGDPVELVGHSLGAATVQQLASDPSVRQKFNIGVVTMLGAPALGGTLPAGVQGLSLRRGNDPVVGLGVKHLRPGPNHIVVVEDKADHAHMADGYANLAREVESNAEPTVGEFNANRNRFLHLDSDPNEVVSRGYSYEATRVVGLEQKELAKQVEIYAP